MKNWLIKRFLPGMCIVALTVSLAACASAPQPGQDVDAEAQETVQETTPEQSEPSATNYGDMTDMSVKSTFEGGEVGKAAEKSRGAGFASFGDPSDSSADDVPSNTAVFIAG